MILLSDFTDWTSIGVDLFTGAAIAFILATYVPKKLNEDRSLKSFFIDELNFLNKGFNDSFSCKALMIFAMFSEQFTVCSQSFSLYSSGI